MALYLVYSKPFTVIYLPLYSFYIPWKPSSILYIRKLWILHRQTTSETKSYTITKRPEISLSNRYGLTSLKITQNASSLIIQFTNSIQILLANDIIVTTPPPQTYPFDILPICLFSCIFFLQRMRWREKGFIRERSPRFRMWKTEGRTI